MSRSSQRFFLLAFAGFASALLITASNRPAFQSGELLIPGLVFGVAIATVFSLHAGVKSPQKLVGLIGASTAAFPISFFSTFGTWMLPDIMGLHLALPGAERFAVFGAGAIGAFIVLLAVHLVVAPPGANAHGIVRCAWLSLAGGVLGVIGWIAAGEGRGQTHGAVKSAILYVLWQTGVAMCIAFVAPAADHEAEPTGHLRRPARLRTLSAFFFVGIFGFLIWQIYKGVGAARAVSQQEALREQIAREAPSVNDLRTVEALAPDQAIINENLGGNFAQQPLVMNLPGHPPRGIVLPEPPSVEYMIGYGPQKELSFSFSTVIVAIDQYPNPAWARFQSKYPPRSRGLNSFPLVQKFGNRIYTDTSLFSGKGGTVYFFWPSGTNVVTVTYQNTDNTNEEFLRRYLEKYPSSL